MPKPIEYTREQRDRAIAEVLIGASLLRAGATAGAPPYVVRRWLAEDGLAPANAHHDKSAHRAEALAALAAGEVPAVVAKRLGVDRKTVCRWRTEAKLAGAK
jgi:transposase-like protein